MLRGQIRIRFYARSHSVFVCDMTIIENLVIIFIGMRNGAQLDDCILFTRSSVVSIRLTCFTF